MALRWRDPDRYRDDFIAILLSHGIGMGLVLKGELFTGTHVVGRRVRPHDPPSRRRAVPLRPARLHRGLCRQLRHLAQCQAWATRMPSPSPTSPTSRHQALAAAARDHDGPERQAFRKAGEAHRLRPRQPVRADRSRAGRLGRRRRDRLRPDGTASARGASPRRPAACIPRRSPSPPSRTRSRSSATAARCAPCSSSTRRSLRPPRPRAAPTPPKPNPRGWRSRRRGWCG